MSTVSGLLNSTRIRGIQRGIISLTGGGGSTTLYLANTTITQVDPNKTELRSLGQTINLQPSSTVSAKIKLLNSTTINISAYGYGGGSITYDVSWELTEYM